MSEKPKGKRNSRKNVKYPNLNSSYNLKTRWDLIDYDYIDKLSEDEKKWLDKFSKEYVNADLNRKNLKKNLHNTKELKKDCDKRNNDRNACILTRSKAAHNQLFYLEDLNEEETNTLDFEDKLNKRLDRQKLTDELLELYNNANNTSNNGKKSK